MLPLFERDRNMNAQRILETVVPQLRPAKRKNRQFEGFYGREDFTNRTKRGGDPLRAGKIENPCSRPDRNRIIAFRAKK